MPDIDPFTRVHQAIWAALTAHAPWAALVRPGNRIDMTRPSFAAPKPDVQAGDTPEAMLLQGAFAISPYGTISGTTGFQQTFTLAITIDRLAVAPLNAVKFQTAVALLKSGIDFGLTGLVREWSIASAKDGDDRHDFGVTGLRFTRESRRWVSVMNIVVDFSMNRGDLLAM